LNLFIFLNKPFRMTTIHLDHDVQNRSCSPTADQSDLYLHFGLHIPASFIIPPSREYEAERRIFRHYNPARLLLLGIKHFTFSAFAKITTNGDGAVYIQAGPASTGVLTYIALPIARWHDWWELGFLCINTSLYVSGVSARRQAFGWLGGLWIL